MDQTSLVIPSIAAAERFLQSLQSNSFPVTAAGWVKEHEVSDWYLFIASPKVEELGIGPAYSLLNTLFRQLAPSPWLDPFRYRLIGATNSIANDIVAYLKKSSANGVSPIRFYGPTLGDLSVEDAFLLPLLPDPAAAVS